MTAGTTEPRTHTILSGYGLCNNILPPYTYIAHRTYRTYRTYHTHHNMSGLLGEKNPDFKQDTRVEGNLSIVEHPSNPSYYGDGSVEVSGTLSTDTFGSATPSAAIKIKSPLNFVNSGPQWVAPGTTQLYADVEHGRLQMSQSDGSIIDLNPLEQPGDLMTFDGILNTTRRLPVGMPGQSLCIDKVRNPSTFMQWASNSIQSGDVSIDVIESSGAGFIQLLGPTQDLAVTSVPPGSTTASYVSVPLAVAARQDLSLIHI